MTASNRVPWESLDQKTFEDMVAVLISRLNPEAQRIDGSGGDGGRDVQVQADDGLVIFELKSFTGRMASPQRKQVKDSLKRASRHEPAKWRLVVPIDPTPGELEWFEQLASGYCFECRWLGKTWLDSEMARKPEIARYYAHDKRYELSEFIDLLQGINAEPPPVQGGIVAAAAERAQSIVDKVNKLDPHYVIGLAFSPNGNVSVSVTPRYPGAEKDRPWARARFEFSDTEEGTSAQRALQESIEFGARNVIPSEFIAELSVDVPVGLGTELEGYEVLLGFPAPDLVDEVRMALVVVDQHGVVLARLPLRAVDVSTGTRGVLISLRDKSEAVTAETRFDATELTFNLKWSYSQPDLFSPLDLLPALKFAAALEGGGRMVIVFNGETLGPQDPGPFRSHSPGEAASYSHFLGDLANIQIKTGVFFDVSSDLTADEERDIEVASRLLNGETVKGTWNQMAIRITPDGREAVEAALVGPSPTHDFQTNSHMSLNLQGEVIPIGQVTNKFESAKVLSWEESEDSSTPGTTTLTLVPAVTDTVTVSLETGSLPG